MDKNTESISEREEREVEEAKEAYLEAFKRLQCGSVVVDALQERVDVSAEEWEMVAAKIEKLQKFYREEINKYFSLRAHINARRIIENRPLLPPHMF